MAFMIRLKLILMRVHIMVNSGEILKKYIFTGRGHYFTGLKLIQMPMNLTADTGEIQIFYFSLFRLPKSWI